MFYAKLILNLGICTGAGWVCPCTEKILSYSQTINSNLIGLIEGLVERSIILKSIDVSSCVVGESLFGDWPSQNIHFQ